MALGIPNADDLVADLAETMAIARRFGDRVILMTTSTGGTLAAVGLNSPEIMNGVEEYYFHITEFWRA